MKIFKIILFSLLLFILGASLTSAATVTDTVTVYVNECTNGAIDVDCTECFDGSTTTPDKACPPIITATTCQIELGEKTCKTNLSWNIFLPLTGVKTSITKSEWIDVVKDGKSSDSKTDNISYGKTIYYLFHGSPDHIASTDVTATCKVGTWNSVKEICEDGGIPPEINVWEDKQCPTPDPLCDGRTYSELPLECVAVGGCTPNTKTLKCEAIPNTCTPPTVSISVKPTSIRIGQSTVVTWTSTKMKSCTGNDNFSTNGLLNSSVTKSNIQKSMTFKINCIGLDNKPYTAETKVYVDVTDIIEI